MTKDEALKLALKTLLRVKEEFSIHQMDTAVTAIKEALAAPVQEPVAIVDEAGVIVVCNYKYKPGDKLYTTPPAAPVQEPVAWMYEDMMGLVGVRVQKEKPIVARPVMPLYTTPPAAQRQWVGLTDEEIENCYGGEIDDFARAIDAKLKEKNT